MSRIRLEWNVESQKIDKSDSEDPLAKRARRRRARLLVMLIVIMLAALAAAVFALRQRSIEVQRQLEQLLRGTVHAETAALRIGDMNTFMSAQDSADETWLQRQQADFRAYSALKSNYEVDMSGTINDLEIDGQRGRVVLEERINGSRYARAWFYFYKSGVGWRHVAPDITFWGENRTLETDVISVRYHELDEPLAEAISATVGEWLRQACLMNSCDGPDRFAIEIVPQAASPVAWADESKASLIILSPLAAGRMSIDAPFDRNLQELVAEALAQL